MKGTYVMEIHKISIFASSERIRISVRKISLLLSDRDIRLDGSMTRSLDCNTVLEDLSSPLPTGYIGAVDIGRSFTHAFGFWRLRLDLSPPPGEVSSLAGTLRA